MLYSKNECWAQNFFVEEKKRRKIEDAKTEDIIGLFFGQTIFFQHRNEKYTLREESYVSIQGRGYTAAVPQQQLSCYSII
jgi:hypothetical protein